MTDRFASAFDPPDPSSLGTPAVQSVQASLYLRLKKARGNKAGDIGWLLVRLAQPDHPRHEPALAALSALGVGDLRALAVTARATCAAPKIAARADARELAAAIVEQLQHMIGERDGAAVVAAMPPAIDFRAAAREMTRAAERRLEASDPSFAADLDRFKAMAKDAPGRDDLRDSLQARTAAEVAASST